MEQRISLITSGVCTLDATADFYEALGWQRVDSQEGVTDFDLSGQTPGLYPIERLVAGIGVGAGTPGRGAATFSYNVCNRRDVAPLLAKAHAAGGKVSRPAVDVFRGGHIGYFSDPESTIWEVSHNPFTRLSENGSFRRNGY